MNKKSYSRIIYLNIADFYIKIIFSKTDWALPEKKFIDQVLDLYQGFIANNVKKIDYVINVSSKKHPEFLRERKTKTTFIDVYKEEDRKITTYYQISLYQFQLILATIIKKLLLETGGLYMHASAIVMNSHALLFMGPSGAGKSTTIKLLKSNFNCIADDTVIIRTYAGKYRLYQTPFYEKEWWVKKASGAYEIKFIFFIKKSNKFHAQKIQEKSKIIKYLFQQLWKGPDTKAYDKYLLDFISWFDNFYILRFKKSEIPLVRYLRNFYVSSFIKNSKPLLKTK